MNDLVLITGVSGFAGWHLARALRRDHRILGTYLTKPVALDDVEGLAIDLSSPDDVRALIRSRRPRAVIHAAALTDPNDCELRPDAATRANEHATRNLATALDSECAAAHLVSFSTDLVYPGTRAFSRETDPVGPVMHYGRTKLAAEAAALARSGPTTVLRCALLYGPPAPYKTGATGWMHDKLARGEGFTLFTDEYRTPVHVADVVALVERLLEAPDGYGVVNLGGSERITRFEMGVALANALGRSAESIQPARLADSAMPAPRPADVSMDTSRAAALLDRPLLPFREGVGLDSRP